MKKQFLEAGRIVNTHGVRGEVKIQPWADSAAFLLDFKRIIIDGKSVNIIKSRVHKQCVIAALDGVEDVNEAMRLKNKVVYIDRNDAELSEGTFFIQDIIGSEVRTEDGNVLGELAEVLNMPAADVYVVKGEREILIPAVPEFIIDTDLERGIITVRLIEGM